MGTPRRAHPLGRLALVLGALVVLTQSALMVGRVLDSPRVDFAVFHRTAQILADGRPADFYAQRDVPTGWLRCIPPSGTMLFAYMPRCSVGVAAVIWAAFNLLLVVACGWCLWRIFARLDRQGRLYRRTWPGAVLVLAVMAGDSLQMGQLSLLFTTCWLAYLAADAGFLAATMLMIPAAIKLYPGLLWAAPLMLRRTRELLWLVPAGALVLVVLPFLAYGPAVFGMYADYFRDSVLTSAKFNAVRVSTYLSNEGLDLVALRYLTHQPALHAAYPHFPHLWLTAATVGRLVNVLRLVVLLVTGLAAWRLGAQARRAPRWTALLMVGLWTATLYLILPEMRSRYAVYVFPAMLPLLAVAESLRGQGRRYLAWCGMLTLIVAAVVQIEPPPLRPYGASLAATLLVWVLLLRLGWRAAPPGRDLQGGHDASAAP